jgi:Flp pilus assembly protein TadD
LFFYVIGILVMFFWGAAEIYQRFRRLRIILAAAVLLVTVFWGLESSRYLTAWKDTQSVFERAVEKTGDNYDAYVVLGFEMQRQNKTAEAIDYLTTAIWLEPNVPQAHLALGMVLSQKGLYAQAGKHFKHAGSLDGISLSYLNDYAVTLIGMGRKEQALEYLERAHSLFPDHKDVAENLAKLRRELGR